MQLVYGVLRHRQYLERVVEILSKTPPHKIDPFVKQAIIVGLYQLFYLERIPQSAAVNEVVESCKIAKIPKRLHGFVNGILRESLRQKAKLQDLSKIDRSGTPLLNHPEWLISKWQKQFGTEETTRICLANNEEPSLVLRINVSSTSRTDFSNLLEVAGIDFTPGSYAPDALVLPGFKGSITAIPGYERGLFQIQDEAAQLATLLLGPLQQKGIYLDGCAGVGTKTAHLQQLGLDHNIQIHAAEPESSRAKLFRQNISRLFPGHQIILHQTTLQEITIQDTPPYSGIIIDAPCSGTGVTGRHPDIRWNRTVRDFRNYHDKQSAILKHGSSLLAPGGILVYATCSLEHEENFDVVDSFLKNNEEFSLTNCEEHLPKVAHQFVKNRCFAPHPSSKIDGFFAARIQRAE